MRAFLRAGLVGLALLLAVPAAGQDMKKGVEAAKRGDYATALREWRPLAEAGDAFAQTFLGAMYLNGEGVPQDYAAALKWYRLAAEQGLAIAQDHLGAIYYKGLGVPQDYAAAHMWSNLAAEQGFADAQANLGAMYFNGQGVPQDYAAAHMWSNLAAAQGNANAAKNRDLAASKMTPADISKAQRLAKEWREKHPQ